LKAGYAGIPEPPSEASRRIADWGEGDLVLVPGIYFDRCGQRIGSGMGFYDRFLAARKCLLWGVCWSEQWVPEEEFPCLPHDVPMARVITDSAVHAIPPFPGRPKSGHSR
jgi:5-formyltetrahydrofolate cyclo-ligase